MSNMIKKTKKSLILLSLYILIIAVGFTLTACTSEIEVFKGDYAIVYTNVFKPQGGILDMDIDGEILAKEEISMQDILFMDNSDEYIILCGQRQNNNLLFDSKGNKKEVYFLNNPKYTGVTAVEQYEDKIAAIMNGNVSDGVYKTLLVLQDIKDKVLYQEIIEMYPRDLLIDNQTLYIGGNRKRADDSQWDSKIMKFDLNDNKFIKEQIDDSLYNFSRLKLLNNQIYALTEDKNYIPRIISIIDKDTLEVKNQKTFDKPIIDIYSSNESLYVLFDDMLCVYDADFNILDSTELWTDDSYYINFDLFMNNELYLFMKAQDKDVLDNGEILMGKILKISLDNFDNTDYTDFIVKDSTNIENVMLFPTSFFK